MSNQHAHPVFAGILDALSGARTLSDGDKLRLARECFLDLIGSAIDWTHDTDLNKHDQPETQYTLVCRDFELRQLVEAFGIRIREDELAHDAIDRALKAG